MLYFDTLFLRFILMLYFDALFWRFILTLFNLALRTHALTTLTLESLCDWKQLGTQKISSLFLRFSYLCHDPEVGTISLNSKIDKCSLRKQNSILFSFLWFWKVNIYCKYFICCCLYSIYGSIPWQMFTKRRKYFLLKVNKLFSLWHFNPCHKFYPLSFWQLSWRLLLCLGSCCNKNERKTHRKVR